MIAACIASLVLWSGCAFQGEPAAWESAAAEADPARRTARLLALLQDSNVAPDSAAIDLAYQVGLEEAAALRLANAAQLQAALHEHVHAAWSAANLALTLSKAGNYAEARDVLGEQLARVTSDSADAGFLHARLALVLLGEGRRRAGLDELGRALLRGDPDAGVVLAREHLLRGRSAAARAGFRALLVREQPGAWALRGWGLTLIDDLGSPAPERTRTQSSRAPRLEDR